MGSPFPWCDVTLGTGPHCDSLTLFQRALVATEITWLLPSPCGSWAGRKPSVQKTRVLWRDVLPPAPEPFSSDRLSSAPLSSVSRRRLARRLPAGRAPRRGHWRGMARQRRPAERCQERVSGCLSAALKRALLGTLGCAKRTSKDVRPDVRSCILVGWVWGKALTSTST